MWVEKRGKSGERLTRNRIDLVTNEVETGEREIWAESQVSS